MYRLVILDFYIISLKENNYVLLHSIKKLRNYPIL